MGGAALPSHFGIHSILELQSKRYLNGTGQQRAELERERLYQHFLRGDNVFMELLATARQEEQAVKCFF